MTESRTKWIVEIKPGYWLNGTLVGQGGITCNVGQARRYEKKRGAQIALGMARKLGDFENAKIEAVWTGPINGQGNGYES
jgi:hypothetical protein